ncbi:MAG: hypothetical protein U0939_02960 [Pirellulales bacterium]
MTPNAEVGANDSPVGESLLTCPLSWPEQRRNLTLFALCTGMQYLAAPVIYVGITQASLCDRLGADARTSNLPGTLFFAMTAMPALIAWLSPRVDALRRNLAACYLVSCVMLGVIAAVLVLDLPPAVKMAVVILQGGVAGATMPTAVALLWEIIGRGSDESRRGLALSLAFGAGPVLAVVGSFLQVTLLGGNFFGWQFAGVAFPYNFAILFGVNCPVMAAAALLTRGFVTPRAASEPQREPIRAVLPLLVGLPALFASVALDHAATVMECHWLRFAGWASAATAAVGIVVHFRGILSQRVLLWATIATVLVYAGNMIPSNMNLFSAEALGAAPEKYAGMQNLLRFGCKVVAGAALGRLLMKTNPLAGFVATAVVFLAAPLWATMATGTWYLAAFGIFGAGELIGVYAPNYLVSASRTDELRRNMAFMTMLMVPVAPMGYLYGAIVNVCRGQSWTVGGSTGEVLGFRASFVVCAALIATGILLALALLPKRPHRGG